MSNNFMDLKNHSDVGMFQAWSNVAYVLAGFFTIVYTTGPLVTFCGISLIMLGLASGIFHYSGIYPAQKGDEIGIYLVLMASLVKLIGAFPALSIIAVLCAAAYMASYHRKFSSFTTAGILGLANFSIAFFLNWQLALASFVIFAIAIALTYLGRKYPEYNEGCHAAWHVLTAEALYLLILV